MATLALAGILICGIVTAVVLAVGNWWPPWYVLCLVIFGSCMYVSVAFVLETYGSHGWPSLAISAVAFVATIAYGQMNWRKWL